MKKENKYTECLRFFPVEKVWQEKIGDTLYLGNNIGPQEYIIYEYLKFKKNDADECQRRLNYPTNYLLYIVLFLLSLYSYVSIAMK